MEIQTPLPILPLFALATHGCLLQLNIVLTSARFPMIDCGSALFWLLRCAPKQGSVLSAFEAVLYTF